MKTFTTFTALVGLLAIATGTAIPRDGDLKDIAPLVADTSATRCQTCSQIFKDCLSQCHDNDCNSSCKKTACNSYVGGLRCGTVCLWYC